ncbi:hypothetical protein BR93DRAFT_971466 [Coniochaeta sp. PMI_546]|nr:hypothetical protein BR93DRAFT_971466 [Coniochaeta sp. PMI_546]
MVSHCTGLYARSVAQLQPDTSSDVQSLVIVPPGTPNSQLPSPDLLIGVWDDAGTCSGTSTATLFRGISTVDSKKVAEFRLIKPLHVGRGLTYFCPHDPDDSNIMQRLPFLLSGLFVAVRTRVANLGLSFDPIWADLVPAWTLELRKVNGIGKIWFIHHLPIRRAGACHVHDSLQRFRRGGHGYVEVVEADESWQIPGENTILYEFIDIIEQQSGIWSRQNIKLTDVGVLAVDVPVHGVTACGGTAWTHNTDTS